MAQVSVHSGSDPSFIKKYAPKDYCGGCCSFNPITWLIDKVFNLVNAIFKWFVGDKKEEVARNHIWEQVSAEQRDEREFAVIPRPRSSRRRADQRRDLADRAVPLRGERDRAEEVAPRSESPLEELAGLSVAALAQREGLEPHAAQLKHFMLHAAMAIGRNVCEKEIYRPQDSLHVNITRFGRMAMDKAATIMPGFSAVNSLLGSLSSLKTFGGDRLPENQEALIGSIHVNCTPEMLMRLFVERTPRPSVEAIEAYQRAVEAFFAMIQNPLENVLAVRFWEGEGILPEMRTAVLDEVFLQLGVGPLTRFLLAEQERTGITIQEILQRCFRENALLIANKLFNRIDALLRHGELPYTQLFDEVIRHANQQAGAVAEVEDRNALILKESEAWREADLSALPGDGIYVKWRSALMDDILRAIDEAPIEKQRLETLLHLERGILLFDRSSCRRELEERRNTRLLDRIDAKLHAIRQQLPREEQAREKLEVSAKRYPEPRFVVQLVLLNAAERANLSRSPQANGANLPVLLDHFKDRLVVDAVQRAHPLQAREGSFRAIAELLLPFLLPEVVAPEREGEAGEAREAERGGNEGLSALIRLAETFIAFMMPRGHGVVAVEDGGDATDGLTALVNELAMPEEFRELFRRAIPVLPGKILPSLWSAQRQGQLEAAVGSPEVRGLVEGVRDLLVDRNLRPFITNLLVEGLGVIFDRVANPQGLDDIMASGVLPQANMQLLWQLSVLSIRKNQAEVAKDCFQAGRRPGELAHAVEVWLIQHHRKEYAARWPGLLSWQDVDERRLQPFLRVKLREFASHLAERGGTGSEAEFQAAVVAHFAAAPPEGDGAAPAVYGALVQNFVKLSRFGDFTADKLIPYFRGVIQEAMVDGMDLYRAGPEVLVHDGVVSLREALPETEIELMFQGPPEEIAARREHLLQDRALLNPAAEAHRPRIAAINAQLEKVEGYLAMHQRKTEEHAPAVVKAALDRQVSLTAQVAYELITGLLRERTSAWYYGWGRAGSLVAWGILRSDASALDTAVHTGYQSLFGHRDLNRDLLFRVFRDVLGTLQALPAPAVERAAVV